MRPWEELARAEAPDETLLELRRRGHEYLIRAGGYDLMSSEDDVSSRALAELGCKHVGPEHPARVLVGGLGMGFSLRAALDAVGPRGRVEVAELVPAVVEWNRRWLGELAGQPLLDPRTEVYVGDVRDRLREPGQGYDAILLDVDNGPDALAHPSNEGLYGRAGLVQAKAALRPGGVLAVWSFSDEPAFTRRLGQAGFAARTHRVAASRKGRGRHHVIWVATCTRPAAPRGRGKAR